MTGGAEVRVESVWKSFDRQVVALRGVSLELSPGELVVLTGPSGSGKTTLLNLVGGLDRADRGRVLVDGVPVPDPREAWSFRRSTVGFVFQLHHLLPGLNARENVEVALLPTTAHRSERSARARELLDVVGLERRASHLPRQLSGGERQRVAVARALANRPRLLLADEPTGSLDSRSGRQVIELIADLRERSGMTVLVVSYDEQLAGRADRVVRIVDGRVAGYASASAGASRLTRQAG